ncbi:HAD family hydrolase [Clostridium psychrophilum]|uniref:HAD family hydrolase n=1 Tax=Clostridium psychrophilum TaxID=132926 RepID=UPI001C0E5A94|nr:HAD family phosphatase [Clostridium psychrophilum]MBU3181782.1 HAD family phosphatase [Clostridium psychrophilum]
MFKAVIFDMDGVLIDSEPHQLKLHEDYLKSKGIYLKPERLNLIVGGNPKLRWDSIKDAFQGKMKREEYEDDYAKYHNKDIEINYKDILNPGVVDILKWLKNESYKVALASSSGMNKIQMVLKQCGIEEYFEAVLSGEMFNNSKPDPEIYLTMVKKLKLEPKDCLVIEDSVYGITASKAAGIYTVALEENRFGFDQSIADEKITNLLELKKILKKDVRT